MPVLVCSQTPEPSSPVLSDPQDQAELDAYRQKAESYVLKNLNRFGLDQLQYYDRTLDTLFEREKRDTLYKMELNFQKESAERKNILAAEKNTSLNSPKASKFLLTVIMVFCAKQPSPFQRGLCWC
ncbi:MAG: hypothetical protein IPJ66_08135 [Bacteroidetes bacterium]|nr:hypothetical protein [Bacteroidota bacterium]